MRFFILSIIIAGSLSCNNRQEQKKAATVISGSEIYKANCTLCHGDDGKKAVQGAADLSKTILNNLQLQEVIRKGKGAMAPFESALSDGEIEAVAGYVQTLKEKQ